ncbi:hypothetical protein [Solitalea koreensis]|uniref:NIPSNAP protein n=1 Tax=Solitalea koreensis TaxID=543615 RepID=A0A521C4X1_9SPHI|nr:hypothetical protein [Solitalea koreensis]SMO54474.1 hypothetical protein SAMN06265350_103218 [Solitalea koreensis]
MKKFFLFLFFVPVLGMSQTKTVVNATRVFPKADKVAEFEKAVAIHAQKYHTGDWRWRIYSIETGPDAGGYNIVEGPSSWEAIDGRGNISAEHNNDWNKNIAPLLTDRGTSGFGEYKAELSTAGLTDYTDKVSLLHLYPKPGKYAQLVEMIKNMKKVWEASNESVAVYESASSGEPSFTIVYRMKNGLKEMAEGYRKPLPERYNALYGAGSFDSFTQKFADVVEKRWEELIFYHSELSSK